MRVVLVLVLSLSPVHAQQPSANQQDDEIVRVKANLVSIDVMVKDKSGKFVRKNPFSSRWQF